jgi:SAM-dependent methyltransferase
MVAMTEAARPSLRTRRPVRFRCNVCGSEVNCAVADLDREIPSCPGCGSNVRFRAIVDILSSELFGKSIALPDFPADKSIAGFGLSDWPGYAEPLAGKLDYRNTYYHKPPHLDITQPDPSYVGSADFIICTEVLEHVPPPVQRAFDNLHRMLKPGGFAVITVPYGLQEDTEEHFPDLHEYRLDDEGPGAARLVNVTRDGREQVFRDLVFHGGDGATLEMRLFSQRGLLRNLRRAGFTDVAVRNERRLEFGILHRYRWSLPVVARKGP